MYQESPSKEKPEKKTEHLYEAILGGKNRIYYLTKFEQFDQKGPGGFRTSWNWPAFLFTGFWALYRKMYIWFLAFLGVSFLAALLGSEGAMGWGVLVFFIPQVIFAVFANSLYHWNIKKKIAVAQLTIIDESNLLEYLRYKGGVHKWAIWIPPLVPVSGILAAIIILQILPYNERDDQDSFPQDNVVNEALTPEEPSAPPALPAESAEDLLKKAAALRAGGHSTDPQKAMEYLNEAVRLKPDFADAYVERGIVNTDMMQYQRAIMDYDKAISLQQAKPNDAATTYNKRATAYNNLGEIQKAIQDYNMAIRLKPDFAAAYNNLGNALIASGNEEKGCYALIRACEMGVCEGYEERKQEGKCQYQSGNISSD